MFDLEKCKVCIIKYKLILPHKHLLINIARMEFFIVDS